MKKIISLFQRNYDGDKLVRNEIVLGTEWVIAGEGIATKKIDGTCCMVKGGVLFRRYDAKRGKIPPFDFIPAQAADPVTGHWPGWILVKDIADDKYFVEAFVKGTFADGTYELLGPKINNNPEKMDGHYLIQHGESLADVPRTFEAIKSFLAGKDIEGIVWHHEDGRMVKIKKKDFGMKR